jgi:adenine-specific DNA-methyltransferase
LEGGMTKEDQKRDEIFWNEILAPDEISRLLDPKVFTNAKRIDANGEQKLDKFRTDEKGDIKDNLIIKGNNLLALHSLKKRFAGKVKLIYIDPPYNTGNDSFKYNDSFNHSTWLTFMKNRLEVAKDLLRDDGIIFISIDDNEQAYLKILCDQIFENNFVASIATITNPAGRDYGGIAKTNDYLLLYTKKGDTELNWIDVEKEFPYRDEKGEFELRELRNRNIRFNIGNRPNLFYPFYLNPKSRDENDFYEISLGKKKGWIEVLPKKSQNIQTVWRWGKERAGKFLNTELVGKKSINNGGYRIMEKYREKKQMARSVWAEKEIRNEIGTLHIKRLFGEKVFDYPKSEFLLKKIIEIGSNEGDLVLDFFSGSGSFGAVADKMGRQYILIEQMENHIRVSRQRLKKVIDGEQIEGGISKSVGWKGGGNFVYLELMKWNENFVDRIQKAKTKEELKKLWETMKEKAFLSYKVDIKEVDEKAKDFADLSIENQKRFLLECLDKNHLYVNYSEIDDEEYGVSKEDKKLNKEFYKS